MGRFSSHLKGLIGSNKKQAVPSSPAPQTTQCLQPDVPRTVEKLASPWTQPQPSEKKALGTIRVTEREVPAENGPEATNNNEKTNGIFDLWAEAFHQLQEREPELASDYIKHIDTFNKSEDSSTIKSNNRTSLLSKDKPAESVIRLLLDDREKKQWKIPVPVLHKNIKVRSQVENLVKFCKFTDGIVKQALSSQPLASLAWSGISILLPLLSTGKTQHDAMLGGFEYIHKIQMYWKIYEERDPISAHPRESDIRRELTKLYSHIVEYHARAICHLSSAQLSRTWQKLVDSNGWDGHRQAIADLDDHCNRLVSETDKSKTEHQRDLQLQMISESKDILSDIRSDMRKNHEDLQAQAAKKLNDAEESALLYTLACTYEQYKDINPRRVKDTCEWFFNDDGFRNWRSHSGSSLLWLSASPGYGKSVLSRCLIDEKRLSNNFTTSIVCYFFFKSGVEGQMDSASALSSVLYQLFKQDLTREMIQKGVLSHRDQRDKLTKNFVEMWRILLACAESNPSGEIVIVLDALDECSQESRKELLDALDAFLSTAGDSNLKFLVTGRPYNDLEESFKRHTDKSSYFRVDGDEKAIEIGKEIDFVIDEKVEEFARGFNPDHRRALLERLKTAQNRTYLWLHLTFDILEKKRPLYSKSSRIQALLNSIPTEMSEAYEAILNHVSNGSEDRFMARAILELVLASTRPLTLDEANYALTLTTAGTKFSALEEIEDELWPKQDFKSTIQNLSGLFITVCDSRLYLIHLTAREFLTDTSRRGQWQGSITTENAHHTMASACVDYLTVVDPGTLNGPLGTSNEGFPFLRYSLTNWSSHYNLQHDDGQKQLCRGARKLCNTSSGRGEQLVQFYDSEFVTALSPDFGPISDLTMACRLGLYPVVLSIIEELGATSEAFSGAYHFAVLEAAFQGFPDVVRTLVKSGGDHRDRTQILSEALSLAIMRIGGLDERQDGVIQVLLDAAGDIHLEDPGLISQAMAMGSKDMITLLLERFPGEINLTPDVLATAASNFRHGHEVMALLLDRRGNEIQVTEDLVVAAAGNFKLAKEVVALLLDRRGDEVRLTADVLDEAARSEQVNLIKLLLQRRGAEVRVTERFLEAALGNYICGLEISEQIFKHKGDKVMITEKLVTTAAENPRFGVNLLRLLIDQKGSDIPIASAAADKAAANPGCGPQVMELLLDQRPQLQLSSRMLELAVQNTYQGDNLLEVLLKRREGDVVMTESMLEKAASNHKCGSELMKLILEADAKVPISAKAVENAAQNSGCGKAVIELMLEKRGKRIPITAKACEQAAANRNFPELAAMLRGSGARN